MGETVGPLRANEAGAHMRALASTCDAVSDYRSARAAPACGLVLARWMIFSFPRFLVFLFSRFRGRALAVGGDGCARGGAEGHRGVEATEARGQRPWARAPITARAGHQPQRGRQAHALYPGHGCPMAPPLPDHIAVRRGEARACDWSWTSWTSWTNWTALDAAAGALGKIHTWHGPPTSMFAAAVAGPQRRSSSPRRMALVHQRLRTHSHHQTGTIVPRPPVPPSPRPLVPSRAALAQSPRANGSACLRRRRSAALSDGRSRGHCERPVYGPLRYRQPLLRPPCRLPYLRSIRHGDRPNARSL